MDRRGFLGVAALAASTPAAAFGQADRDEEAAVRRVVQRYVDAREARERARIEPILTPDADQLVSDGTWRTGPGRTREGDARVVASEPGQAGDRGDLGPISVGGGGRRRRPLHPEGAEGVARIA